MIIDTINSLKYKVEKNNYKFVYEYLYYLLLILTLRSDCLYFEIKLNTTYSVMRNTRKSGKQLRKSLGW